MHWLQGNLSMPMTSSQLKIDDEEEKGQQQQQVAIDDPVELALAEQEDDADDSESRDAIGRLQVYVDSLRVQTINEEESRSSA